MADELNIKRIIELQQKTSPEEGDCFAVDNANSGTSRITIQNLLDPTFSSNLKAAPAAMTKEKIDEVMAVFAGGIDEAVDNWLDEHPEATTTVQDGSITEAKFSDALQLATIKDYVIPEMFGAKGDNSTNDTVAIQNAINYAQTNNKELHFLKKQYKVTDTIVVSGSLNIYGSGCFINGNIDNKPTMKYTHSSEIRGHVLSKVGIRNYGTGNALEIETEEGYAFISCLITECSFYAVSGWCLKVGEGFAHTKVQLCTFSGNGIYAECGDANVFEKNMFFGANSTGIYLNTPSYGELNNAIINNTIVNAGYAILIDSGDDTWICNNQIEYNGSSDSTNNPSAMVYLRGNTRAVKHCLIQKNNFGGGTHLNYCLYINCGDENIISGNRFVATNISDIHVMNGGATGSTRNYFMDDNTSITQVHNPRTDIYQKVKVTAALPKCIIGCWFEVTFNDSARTIRVKKTKEGMLIFSPATCERASIGQGITDLFTLPIGYRPSVNTYTTAWWTGAGTPQEVQLKIGYNGVVSFLEEKIFNNCEIMIPPVIVPF